MYLIEDELAAAPKHVASPRREICRRKAEWSLLSALPFFWTSPSPHSGGVQDRRAPRSGVRWVTASKATSIPWSVVANRKPSRRSVRLPLSTPVGIVRARQRGRRIQQRGWASARRAHRSTSLFRWQCDPVPSSLDSQGIPRYAYPLGAGNTRAGVDGAIGGLAPGHVFRVPLPLLGHLADTPTVGAPFSLRSPEHAVDDSPQERDRTRERPPGDQDRPWPARRRRTEARKRADHVNPHALSA